MTDPKTKLVQSQIGTDPAHGSVPPPLYMSSTYLWPNPSEKGEYDYGRTNNPNRDGLAQTLAELDGGAGAVITSSGCLLYTSPSPRDRTRSRMPSSA